MPKTGPRLGGIPRRNRKPRRTKFYPISVELTRNVYVTPHSETWKLSRRPYITATMSFLCFRRLESQKSIKLFRSESPVSWNIITPLSTMGARNRSPSYICSMLMAKKKQTSDSHYPDIASWISAQPKEQRTTLRAALKCLRKLYQENLSTDLMWWYEVGVQVKKFFPEGRNYGANVTQTVKEAGRKPIPCPRDRPI